MCELPSTADAVAFADGLENCADCYSDRVIVVLAAEVARLRAELAAMKLTTHPTKESHMPETLKLFAVENGKLRAEVDRLARQSAESAMAFEVLRAQYDRLAAGTTPITPTREQWRDCCRDLAERYQALVAKRGWFPASELDWFAKLNDKEQNQPSSTLCPPSTSH